MANEVWNLAPSDQSARDRARGISRAITCAVVSCLLSTLGIGLHARESVKYRIEGADTMVEADLAYPEGPAQKAAVVLLHDGGGWPHRTTEQYARALNSAGFVTLQPRLFDVYPTGARHAQYVPHAYGALAFLATKPGIDAKRIAVAGFSFGGMVSIQSAVAESAQRHGTSNLRFAVHAAFYPLCWVFADLASGKIKGALPTEAFRQWTGVPIRIYAGALDDYDDRDPSMCDKFVSMLPESQRGIFSVQVYQNATHSWDGMFTVSNFDPFACKGRGCVRHNIPNPEVTEQGIADLVAFISRALRVAP